MADSIRERLLAAITTAAQAEYGEYIAVDDELPVTVVADGDDQATTDRYGITTSAMPVTIARAAKATSTAKAARRKQAHDAIVLMVQRMFTDATFGGLAKRVDYTGCGIQTEGAGAVITAQAFFTVTYQHLAGDPTALPGVFD